MPVSSGKIDIRNIDKPYQYFEIGSLISLNPPGEPDTVFEVMSPMRTSRYDNNVGLCTGCDMSKYCSDGSITFSKKIFIPDCNPHTRVDHRPVIFKRV